MTGDWNTALSEIDTYNYQFQRNTRSRDSFNAYIKKITLLIYGENKIKKKDLHGALKKPLKDHAWIIS